MLKSEYIEDVFIEFYDHAMHSGISLAQQDQSAANSFYSVIYDGRQLTEAQANYIIKILEKHKNVMAYKGFDYRGILASGPKWKNPFRVIDYSKKVFVEKNSDGRVDVCLRFPYQLKKEFEADFEKNSDSFTNTWDSEAKLRRVPLYKTNLIQVYDFVKKHNFEIDETFLIAMGEVEEIWQNQDTITPGCDIEQNVVLANCHNDDVMTFFMSHMTGHDTTDLLTAKAMGYPLRVENPQNLVEKIASTEETQFWIKDLNTFVDLAYSIHGKTCIVLDRQADDVAWTKSFVEAVRKKYLPTDKIRVCFRHSKHEDRGFNQWIKDNEVGGPVEDGQIFIFKHTPAKWLFKDEKNVKIVASNGLYPHAGPITREWFDSHPCVIFVGDIKPTQSRNKKIVEL